MNNEPNKKIVIEETTIKLLTTNMKSFRELEKKLELVKKLEDFLEDEGDWFSQSAWRRSRRRSSTRRRTTRRFSFGSLIPKKKDYNKLKAKAEKEKAAAVKALQDVKNEMAKLAEGVKLSTAQMEEEWKKLTAIKAYGAALAKVDQQNKIIASKDGLIKHYAAKC